MKWAISVTVNYPEDKDQEELTGKANSSASLATWIDWVLSDRQEATSFLISVVPLKPVTKM